MPELSAVLEQSVVFQEHRVCSNWTYFSFGCVLTGQSNIAQEWVPLEFGDLGAGNEEPPYPDAVEMMAERFAAGGFETALVGSHPFLDERYNLFQGYQSAILVTASDAERVGLEAVAKSTDFLLRQPWMMHVHFNDPHLPYKARPNYTPGFDSLPKMGIDFTSDELLGDLVARWSSLKEADRANVLTNLNAYYNGEVSYMDAKFGEMWDLWEEQGFLEDTLVVFFTDHGEQFFEHGHFGHRATLFGEETRSLLAFWHSDLPAARTNWTSANEDILPTLLSIFGLPGMEQGGLILNEMEEAPDSPVFAVHGGKESGIIQSVRMGQDYLI
jgi:arylsulfatase A-like enzyme